MWLFVLGAQTQVFKQLLVIGDEQRHGQQTSAGGIGPV